jgi:hypothetical protein
MQFPLSHTPPSMPIGSLEAPSSKRPRSGSISGRLRSASDLCEDGTINQNQKGLVKDMIISGDSNMAHALEEYEKGNPRPIRKLLTSNAFNRRSSIDLVAELGIEQMDINMFDFDEGAGLDGTENDAFGDDLDDMMPFTFYDDPAIGTRGQSQSFSIPNDIDHNNNNNNSSKTNNNNNYNSNNNNKERRKSNRERTFSQIFDAPGTGGDNLFGELGDDAVNDFRTGHAFSIDGGEDGYGGLDFYGTSPTSKNRSQSFRSSSGSVSSYNAPGSRKNSTIGITKSSSSNSSNTSKSYKAKSTAALSKSKSSSKYSKSLSSKSKSSISSSSYANKHKSSGLKKSSGYSSNNNNNNNNAKKETSSSSYYSSKDSSGNGLSSYSSSSNSSNLGSKPVAIPGRSSNKNDDGSNKIGIYSPESRRLRIQRFMEKRKRRIWTKRVKYDVRKNFADSRLRVKGRFVKKEDEELLRELMNMT